MQHALQAGSTNEAAQCAHMRATVGYGESTASLQPKSKFTVPSWPSWPNQNRPLTLLPIPQGRNKVVTHAIAWMKTISEVKKASHKRTHTI